MNNNSKKQIHIKMPYDLHRRLRVISAIQETSIQDYVIKAIKTQIKKDAITESDK